MTSTACSRSSRMVGSRSVAVFRPAVAKTTYTIGQPRPSSSRMAPVKLAIARWARVGSRPASQAITASTANSGRVCSHARIARARPWEMRNCAASAPHATRNADARMLGNVHSADSADVIGDALYRERHENLVCVRDIELYSLCEHHLLPFFGKAHVAYLPNGRLVGLSKIPRVIEVFARRLQVQERLTDQVADALMEVLEPRGVGVVIEAYHLCMMMRGVEKQNSKTVTSALRGALLQDAKTSDEF